jgi:hypothetical protein
MRSRRSSSVLDLGDELDDALRPWMCPQCHHVYQPPVTTYISPIDGRERCAACADQSAWS